MANKKITDLPAATGLTADDLFEISNDPAGVPVSQKLTGAQLRTFIGAQLYIDRAPAAPDDVNLPALSYPAGGGSIQQWDVGTAAWV